MKKALEAGKIFAITIGCTLALPAWASRGVTPPADAEDAAAVEMPDGDNSFVPREHEPKTDSQAAMQKMDADLTQMREPGDIARARREEKQAARKRQSRIREKATHLPAQKKKPARAAEDLEAQSMDDVLRAYQAAPERFDSDFEGEAYEHQNGDGVSATNDN